MAAGSYLIATASGAATVTASSRGASLVSPAVLYQRVIERESGARLTAQLVV